jgi:hypothetical protein
MQIFAILLVFAAASCQTADSMATNSAKPLPRIEITTDGGFAGRGIGSVAIEGTAITARDLSRTCDGPLGAADQKKIEAALASFSEVTRGDAHPDQIHYVLTAGGRKASWYGEAPPAAAAALFEAVWPLRQQVLAGCK